MLFTCHIRQVLFCKFSNYVIRMYLVISVGIGVSLQIPCGVVAACTFVKYLSFEEVNVIRTN